MRSYSSEHCRRQVPPVRSRPAGTISGAIMRHYGCCGATI